MPTLDHERRHGWPDRPVAGVDEAGRGPLAGPVVAAAVILPVGLPDPLRAELNDGKQVKPADRERLAEALRTTPRAAMAIGVATVAEIDRLNILKASDLAMRRALAGLARPPGHALIDGNRVPADLCCPATAVVKGDALSLSIAAASILAKTVRDQMMGELATEHPGYGWERNAGYGTAEHRAAIARLGVTRHHRRSFGTVRKQLSLTP